MITPIPVTESVSTLIMPYMIFSGALLVIFMRTGWALVRWEGILFLLGYISYLAVSVIYGIYNKN